MATDQNPTTPWWKDDPPKRWSLANVGAIPGTGNKHRGHLFRRPRNISIKRALVGIFDRLRGVAVPPDSYDDIRISADRHRSWKRHRRNRWKEPPS